MSARKKSPSYEIKPEDRRLMVEAGVQWYLNTKAEYEKSGAWDPALIFEDERFQKLPADVQDEIKATVRRQAQEEEKSAGEARLRPRGDIYRELNALDIDPEKTVKQNIDQEFKKWAALRDTLRKRIESLRPHKPADVAEAARLIEGELDELLGYEIGEGLIEEYALRREGERVILGAEHRPEYLRTLHDLYTQSVESGGEEGGQSEWIDYLEEVIREFQELERMKLEDLRDLKERLEERMGEAIHKSAARREKQAKQEAEAEPPEWVRSETELQNYVLENLYQGRVLWVYETMDADAQAIEQEEEAREIRLAEGGPRPLESIVQEMEKIKHESEEGVRGLRRVYGNISRADQKQLDEIERSREADRFWYKYSRFDLEHLQGLQAQIEQLTPSRAISGQAIEHWKVYVNTIVGKAAELYKMAYDEYSGIYKALAERRAELAKQEEERIRKEEARGFKERALPYLTEKGIEQVKESFDRWLEKKRDQARGAGEKWEAWPKEKIARNLFKRSTNDAAKAIFVGLASQNGELRFDADHLEEDLDLEIARFKAVVEHFGAGLEAALDAKEIEQAAVEVSREREEKDGAFFWGYAGITSGDWAWILKVGQNEIPEQVTAEDILNYTGLKADSPTARKLFEFLDFLEAARRLQGVKEYAQSRLKRREAEKAAPERKEKGIPKGAWQSRAEFFVLGHILNAKAGEPFYDLQDEARALVDDRSKERVSRLRSLVLRVIEEKGVSVPGARREQSLESGQNQAQWWDRVAIQKPGEKKTQYAHGLVRGIWGPGKGPLVMDVYDIQSGALVKSGEQVPEAWVRELHYAAPASLDGRCAIELLRLAGVKAYDREFPEIPGSKKNVDYVLAGEAHPQSALGVNTGGVEGVGFTGAQRPLTRARDERFEPEPGSAEEVYRKFNALRKEKKPLPDDFFTQVSPGRLQMFLDHHSPRSSQKTAGVKYLYEFLSAIGGFDHLKPKERASLERAIQFVVYDDNKAHPHYQGRFWRDRWEQAGHRTALGLAKFMTLEKLMAIYQKYGDSIDTDIRELSDQELQEFGLAEVSGKQKELTERAGKEFDELVKQGYVLEGTKYGPVLVLPLQMEADGRLFKKYLIGGIDMVAARFGVGGIMHYNHISGELFFSTTGAPLDRRGMARARRKLGEVEILRGTMLIGKGVHARLEDVARALLKDWEAPEGEADLIVGAVLLNYGNPENPQGERAQRVRYAPERIAVEHEPTRLYERLAHLWGGPVPLEVDRQGRMKVQHWWRPELNAPLRRERVYVELKPEHVGQVDPFRAIDRNKRYFIRPTHMEEDPIEGWRMVIAELEGECADSAGARELEEAVKQNIAGQMGIPVTELRSSMWVPQWRAIWERYQEIKAQGGS